MFLLLIKPLSTLEIGLFFFMHYVVHDASDINDHTKHTKDMTMKTNLILLRSNINGYANEHKSITLIETVSRNPSS